MSMLFLSSLFSSIGTIFFISSILTRCFVTEKDLVQKYAEVKAANASLEVERQHAANSTNNRDSEVMALRLKLENMERSSSDYKVFLHSSW